MQKQKSGCITQPQNMDSNDKYSTEKKRSAAFAQKHRFENKSLPLNSMFFIHLVV